MLPSYFARLTVSEQLEVRNGIRNQGRNSSNPLELVRSLYRLRTEINPARIANITNYWIDDTKYPKLHIESECTSTEGDSKWHQEVTFLSPELSINANPRQLKIPVRDKSGRFIDGEYWFLTPLPVNCPVKLRCSCPDFQHTFMWEDYDVNSLKGQRISYLSTGSRAPRNPDHHSGICKHLGALLYILQTKTDVMVKSPQLRPGNLYY